MAADGTHPVGLVPDDLKSLMACPQCDALYRAVTPSPGQRAVCTRCHTVIAAPRVKAGMLIICMSITVVVLIVGATFLPFLQLELAGAGNAISVFDAVLVFSGDEFAALVLIVAALILVIPVTRALLTLYVLVPIVFDRPPARHARAAFRWSETLRPWSMAEIFAIGCAVALVKLADVADIGFGPAFWMFAVVVVAIVLQERLICRWSVWNSLDQNGS